MFLKKSDQICYGDIYCLVKDYEDDVYKVSKGTYVMAHHVMTAGDDILVSVCDAGGSAVTVDRDCLSDEPVHFYPWWDKLFLSLCVAFSVLTGISILAVFIFCFVFSDAAWDFIPVFALGICISGILTVMFIWALSSGIYESDSAFARSNLKDLKKLLKKKKSDQKTD